AGHRLRVHGTRRLIGSKQFVGLLKQHQDWQSTKKRQIDGSERFIHFQASTSVGTRFCCTSYACSFNNQLMDELKKERARRP
ncbi:MAG: hypothetical protein VW338_05580, partial [Rhodospirillaceae bacterium]